MPGVQLETAVAELYGAIFADTHVVTMKSGLGLVPAVHVAGSTTLGPNNVSGLHVVLIKLGPTGGFTVVQLAA